MIFMTNVADLVNAVKERKTKEFALYDKVKFICETLGTKYSNDGVDTYIYEGDGLRFALNEGSLLDKSLFKDVIVQTLDHDNFFCYFNNLSTKTGRADKYVPGEWERLLESHYKMSLCNI
jgi:hypothetical protein